MIIKDYLNREHKFTVDTTKFGLKAEENSKSKKQYQLGQILVKIYGHTGLLEDCPLPGCGNLSFDFWYPHKNLAFEYDGIQHVQYNKFFHGTKDKFVKQIKLDSRKQDIANKNNIRLISISHDIDITFENIKKLILES